MRILKMNNVLIISWLFCQRVVQAHYIRNQPLNKVLIDKKEAALFLSHGNRVERSSTPDLCYVTENEKACEAHNTACKTDEFREYLCMKGSNACPSNMMCTIVGGWCPVHYKIICNNVCDISVVPRCTNGGTCMSIGAEDYTCICPEGFTGKHCDDDLNECLANPCQHSASCNNSIGNYSCNCPSRFTGQNCELDRCKIGPADIVFLLDSSLSEGIDNFNQQLDFIKEFVKSVYIGPTFVRVSVITFSFNARVEFNLKTYLENTTLLDAIDRIQYDAGVTNTGSALRAAREEVFPDNRKNVKKRVIILTDGLSTNRSDTRLQAKLLKDAGVNIVAIGIGSEVLHEELLEMASDYSDVFTVSTFDGLYSTQRKIGIYVCEVVQAHYSRNQPLNEVLMDKKEAAFFLSRGSRVERSSTPRFCYDVSQEESCEESDTACQTEEFKEYLCTKGPNACPINTKCTLVGRWCPVHYRTKCTNVCDILGVPRCNNGGTCVNTGAETYTCICPEGFTGMHCDDDLNECLANPCQHSASCNNSIGNYSCNCPSRFTGQNCELDTCKIGPADIVFLVDSSLSEGKDNFNKQLDFIKEFVKSVYIGPTFVRVSVITFSSNARVEFNLTTYLENKTLLDAIDRIQYNPGVTNTGSALRAAREEVFPENRKNVKKRVMILTDGLSTNRSDTRVQAQLLKDAGVNIVAIGIGSEVLHEELLEMASDYSDVFTVSTFDGLYSIQRKIGIYVCEVCHPKMSDVLYLMDAGKLVTFAEFQGAINALHYVTSLLLGSNDVRVSLVTYAAEPDMKFNFTNGLTEIQIHKMIAILSKEIQPSNHTKALEYVYQNGFTTRNGARNATRKVIVHLTNGQGIDNDTNHLADMLKNDGKIMIEIGFRDYIDRTAMLNLASYSYMFYHLGEEQFADVKILRSLKSLSEYEVCNV